MANETKTTIGFHRSMDGSGYDVPAWRVGNVTWRIGDTAWIAGEPDTEPAKCRITAASIGKITTCTVRMERDGTLVRDVPLDILFKNPGDTKDIARIRQPLAAKYPKRPIRYAAVPDFDGVPIPVPGYVLSRKANGRVLFRILTDAEKKIRFLPRCLITETDEDCRKLCDSISMEIVNKHLRRIQKDQPEPEKTPKKDADWIPLSLRHPTEEEVRENDGRFLVSDGMQTYQRLYNPKIKAFCYQKFNTMGKRHDTAIDDAVLAWYPFPEKYEP